MKDRKKTGVDLGLTDDEKQYLLLLARKTIEKRFKPETEIPEPPAGTTLNQPRGAFVTLNRAGRLRGCIGFIRAVKPLIEIIPEMAIAAAFQDPRFEPLQPDELDDLEIEISVLTPLQEIKDPEEIIPGKHGIMIIKGPFSGLLLPQVATDHNWDRYTFLSQTCMKAGLPPDAWQENDTKIYVFSADVF